MKVAGNIVIGNLQQTSTYLLDTGVADAYVVSFLPPITGYTDGLQVIFKAANANTGACTLEVDGYGPVQIVKDANQALGIGDILAGEIINVIHDGTYFQMIATPQVNQQPFGTFVIDGGETVYAGTGLNYDVSAVNYVILGVTYHADEAIKTLSAADPTNDRIDLVIADTAGTIQIITGTPSANPLEPSYDPSTQIPLHFITVGAGTTTPACALLTTVYKENAGTPTEWATVSSSPVAINVNSTSNPRNGTKDIEGTAAPVGATITFTPVAPILSTDFTQLDIYIRSKGSWGTTGAGHNILVTFFNGSTQLGIPVVIPPRSAFGFDSSITGSYQQVVLLKTLFGIPDGNTITSMVFTIGGSDGTMGFYLDDISIETGCVVPASPLFNNGLTRTGNAVQFGGSLLHTTIFQTGVNEMRFLGARAHNYSYQFITSVPPNVSTAIASFGHNDTNSSFFAGNINSDSTVLGINYTNGIISPYDTSFFGLNNVGYWIGTNITGNDSTSLNQNDNTSKNTGIYFHTQDDSYNPLGVDIFASPALGGTTIADMTPYISASFLTNGQLRLPRYSTFGFDDTPDRALGILSDGTVITYTPGGGSTMRFGVLGEDDTASQDRHFETTGHQFTLESNDSFIPLNVVANGASTAISVSTTGFLSTGIGVGSTGIGINAASSGLVAGWFSTSVDDVFTPVGLFYKNPATNINGIASVLRLFRDTQSSAAGNGIGGQIEFYVRRDGGPTTATNYLTSKWVDAANATATAQFEIWGVNNGSGSPSQLATFNGTGQIGFTNYGTGVFTGTLAKVLGVTSSGNIIEVNSSSIGKRFGVSGEDDTAGEDRTFDLGASHTFIFNSGGGTKSVQFGTGYGLEVNSVSGAAFLAQGGQEAILAYNSNATHASIVGFNNYSSGGPVAIFDSQGSSATSINVLTLRNTSGTGNNGIVLPFLNVGSTPSIPELTNSISSTWTTPSSVSYFTISGVSGNLLGLQSDGEARLFQYGSGTFTGSVAKYLAVDSNGFIIEDSGTSGGTLSGLSDVNITSPADGEILKYDSGSSKWVNGTSPIPNELTIFMQQINPGDDPTDYGAYGNTGYFGSYTLHWISAGFWKVVFGSSIFTGAEWTYATGVDGSAGGYCFTFYNPIVSGEFDSIYILIADATGAVSDYGGVLSLTIKHYS